MPARYANPPALPAPTGYSHVVSIPPGHTVIHVSGQVGLDAHGALPGDGGFEAQARQAFANLQAALADAGAGMHDLVKINLFVTDMGQLATLRRVRDDFLDPARLPASTLVQLVALFRPDLMVEVDGMALLPGAR